MILVLALSAIVAAAGGVLLGALLANYLPRVVLMVTWGITAVSAAVVFLQGQRAEEFDRIGANILVLGILVPLLAGSLLAGWLVLRRTNR